MKKKILKCTNCDTEIAYDNSDLMIINGKYSLSCPDCGKIFYNVDLL